jgi:hypothetical protein
MHGWYRHKLNPMETVKLYLLVTDVEPAFKIAVIRHKKQRELK